ncbi:MAG: hypothetical protein SLRJCFUN_000324 [Candidatus Fervidibacter sp.]|jgi:hypothetical protein
MSKGTMLAMVLGVVFIAVGAVLTIVWRGDVWLVLKGILGPLLLLGGALVCAIAYSEYQAAKEMERLTAQTQTQTAPPTQPATTTPSSEQTPPSQS